MDFSVRSASKSDFAKAMDWAAAEGWNPGLGDLAAFHGADPGGFFMGWVGDRPVSSISVVRYGNQFGFLGFYIVHPDFRGRGYGVLTWETGMAHLAGRVVGLDGVLEQLDNYRRSGFEFAGKNIRFEGVAKPSDRPQSAEVRDARSDDIDQIVGYDQKFFPADRTAFIKGWIDSGATSGRKSKIATYGSKITGFATIRKSHQGYKIGPLFADSSDVAQDLFLGLCAELPAGDTVVLDVPEANQRGIDLATGFGMQPGFETARMYRGVAPDLPISKIFGVTSFELG